MAGFIVPYLWQTTSHLIKALAIVALGGMTFFLAATQDIFALLTLHLHLCNAITSRICEWQLEALGGLWNLFRGAYLVVVRFLVNRGRSSCKC